MTNLRDDLIVAYKKGNFLQVVYDKSLGERGNRDDLVDELVSLHNDGLLDVIAGFRTLQNKSDSKIEFFSARNILEKALPLLDSPVKPVMECVLHLINEAGQDMYAGTPFNTFIDFCAAETSRPKESLKHIEASIDQLVDLLSPTIVAGARIDTQYYLNDAIRLTQHVNIEIRKRAIFSLGRIQSLKDPNLCESAIVCLERSYSKETDDHLLGNLIKSAFRLYKHDKSQYERIIDLINRALSKDRTLSELGDYTLYAASELFCLDFGELPESLLDILLNHLRCVSYEHKGTLRNIDYGLVNLLKRADPSKGIEFLEAVLLANPDDILLEIFDGVIHEICRNNNLFSKLLTKWFLLGDRVLCEGISTVVKNTINQNMQLEVNKSELISTDQVHIIFLARKVIGYLFFRPVTAASVIISLMHNTTEDETLRELGTILYDPLLLNLPGEIKDYLIKQKEIKSGKIKSMLETALRTFDEYLVNLKSAGVIPELHPTQAQREAHHRYFSRLLSTSFEEAQKKSVIFSLASKSVLLYGRKSINYAYSSDGKSNRVEIPLQSHGTDMEFPRIEIIDPFRMDYMLRIFRAERIIT